MCKIADILALISMKYQAFSLYTYTYNPQIHLIQEKLDTHPSPQTPLIFKIKVYF